jgi:hypothetical protein
VEVAAEHAAKRAWDVDKELDARGISRDEAMSTTVVFS